MSKKYNILIMAFSIIFVMLCALALLPTDRRTANAEINYNAEITVSNLSGGGYEYGNNSSTAQADTLQEIFDAVAGNTSTSINAVINFNNVTTSDKVILEYSKKTVIKGKVIFDGEVEDSFLTVKSGVFEIYGALITSYKSNIVKVMEGAEFILSTGGILEITGEASGMILAAIYNYGKTTIEAGIIKYLSTAYGNAGACITQIGENSQLVVNESAEGAVLMTGKSVLRIISGQATINGGTYSATSVDSSENGSALKILENAKVTISGGEFSSVSLDKVILLAGNVNSSFSYNGGKVKGKIRLSSSAETAGTRAVVNNRTIYPTQYGNVYLYSEEEYMTPANAKLGFFGLNGYYSVGWNDVSVKNPSLAEFNDGASIKPVLSNLYDVSINVGTIVKNLTVPYGSIVYPFSYEEIKVDSGYQVDYWQKNGERTTAPFEITGNDNFVAVLKLSIPNLVNIDDVEFVYDEKTRYVTPSYEKIDGLEYTYSWEINNNNHWEEVSTEKDLVIKNVIDSGIYRCKLTVNDGVDVTSTYSNQFLVTISKGNYSDVEHRSLSGVYSPMKTLADYSLDEGFIFVDNTIVPTVPVTKYSAQYCLDENNYNPYNIDIELILDKAPAVEASHTLIANNYVYDAKKTLADYPFGTENEEKYWRWADVNIVPNAGVNAYVALYNKDVDNYYDYSTTVVLSIEKGYYTDVPSISITLEYEARLYVNSAIRNNPDVFKYYSLQNPVDGMTLLNVLGEHKFDAFYNADPDNYNNFATALFITIIKGKAPIENYNEDNTIDGGVYSPTKRLADVELKSDEWRWQNPDIVPTVNQKTYYLIYNPDVELYSDYVLEVIVNISKANVPEEEKLHEGFVGIYSPMKSLAEYPLEKGWTWIDNTIVPIVNTTEYEAIYVKNENYNEYHGTIKIELQKATYDMSSIRMEDKEVEYDGNGHSINYEGQLPDGVIFNGYEPAAPIVNAGKYTISAYFTQEDVENYNLIERAITATLIINRISYDVSGIVFKDKEVTYDGNAHALEVEGTLPNGIRVDYYENNDNNVMVGVYQVVAVLKQDDLINYEIVENLVAYLTITKAKPTFSISERKEFAYDGKEHLPEVSVNNEEQNLLKETSDNFVDVGEHTIRYYVLESSNYLADERIVKISINPNNVVLDGMYDGTFSTLLGKVVNEDEGIKNGAQLTMDVVEKDNYKVLVNILLDGEAKEGAFKVMLLLPTEFADNVPKVQVKLEDGQYVDVEAGVMGNYLIFNTQKLGKFLLSTDTSWDIVKIGPMIEWWGYLLIAIAVAIVCAGVVVCVILLKRKGLLPRFTKENVITEVKVEDNDTEQNSEGVNNEEK